MFILTYLTLTILCLVVFKDKAVTSLQAELGREITMKEVQKILQQKIINLFEMNLECSYDPGY